MKNFRNLINFNAFGVEGVAKNGEIVFEKIRIFRLREYPRSSSAMPGGMLRRTAHIGAVVDAIGVRIARDNR